MDYNIIKGKVVLVNTVDAFSGTASVRDAEYIDNGIYMCKMSITNTTTTPTLNINSIGAKTIVKNDGSALSAGDLVLNGWYMFQFDSGLDKFISYGILAGMSGIWGISNSTGTFTYFSTYAAARTASVTTDVITLFANTTENIILKADVAIQGNGYTLTGVSGTSCITMSATVNIDIYNLKIVCADGSNTSLVLSNSSTIRLPGTTVNNSLGTSINVASGCTLSYGKTLGRGMINAGDLDNHIAEGSTSQTCISNTGIIRYCYATNSSTGKAIAMTAGESHHCEAYSASGVAFDFTNGLVFKLIAKSDGTFGITQFSGSGILIESDGYSTAERAISVKFARKSFAYSTSTNAFEIANDGYQITGESTAGAGILTAGTNVQLTRPEAFAIVDSAMIVGNSGDLRVIKGIFITRWNDAAGDTVKIASATATSYLANCYFETTHATADATVAVSAVNVFITSADCRVASGVLIGTNVTQSDATTQDARGTRFLN